MQVSLIIIAVTKSQVLKRINFQAFRKAFMKYYILFKEKQHYRLLKSDKELSFLKLKYSSDFILEVDVDFFYRLRYGLYNYDPIEI